MWYNLHRRHKRSRRTKEEFYTSLKHVITPQKVDLVTLTNEHHLTLKNNTIGIEAGSIMSGRVTNSKNTHIKDNYLHIIVNKDCMGKPLDKTHTSNTQTSSIHISKDFNKVGDKSLNASHTRCSSKLNHINLGNSDRSDKHEISNVQRRRILTNLERSHISLGYLHWL